MGFIKVSVGTLPLAKLSGIPLPLAVYRLKRFLLSFIFIGLPLPQGYGLSKCLETVRVRH